MWMNKDHCGLEFWFVGQQFFDPLLSYFQMREPDESLDHAVGVVADRIKHWPANACVELADSESLPHMMAETGWPLVRSLHLDFGDNLNVVESLVTTAHCQNLEELVLKGGNLDVALVKKMVSSPFLKGLRKLSLFCSLGDEEFEIFATSSLAKRLEELPGWELRLLSHRSDLALKRIYVASRELKLLKAPFVDNLESLDVSVDTLKGMVKLKNASWLHPRITGISWGGTSEKAAAVLADFTELKRLRRLRIGGHVRNRPRLTRALRTLAGASFLSQLKELDLSTTHAGDAVIEALSAWPLESLRSLDLYGARCTDDGIEALAKNKSIKALRFLNLRSNSITDEGLGRLVTWPGVSALERLDLWGNPISQAGVIRLASSPFLGNLRSLRLSYGEEEGSIEALAQSKTLENLEQLSLSSDASRRDCKALVDSALFQNLVELDLGGCGISDEGVQILFGGEAPPRLLWLSLRCNQITDQGIDILARSDVLKNLTWLELDANDYGDAGLEALANAPFSPWLCKLAVLGFGSSGEGMRCLAESKTARSLRWLGLGIPGEGNEFVLPWMESANVSPIIKARLSSCYFDVGLDD